MDCNNCWKKKLRDLAQGCKVGDIVYVLRWKREHYDYICTTKRQIERFKNHGKLYVGQKQFRKSDINFLGKTVFLTREDAEKAIQEYTKM